MYTKIAAAVVIALALGASHWRAYTRGQNDVQARWNAERLETAKATLRLIEQRDRDQIELNARARRIDHAYQAEKSRRAAADRAAAGLRDELTAALDRAASDDPGAPSGVDGADPRPAIAGECVRQLVALESAYGIVAGKARALQEFTRELCVRPEP